MNIRDQRFLIPGAAIAREILGEKLLEFGAIVDSIAIYQTILPDLTETAEIINRLLSEKIDYITFTSSSTVINFLEIIKNYPVEKILADVKIVCIGPVTTATVTEYLNISPLTAETYNIDGMIETIINDIKK
jgi:uroporphyrinogen III methyltransferase/synthase